MLIGIGLFYQRMLGRAAGAAAAAAGAGSADSNRRVALIGLWINLARQFVVGESQAIRILATALAMDERRRAIIEQIPRMRRYARSLVRDRDAADDLVQDSLERALSRMDRWVTGDLPRRWLFTIMHHLFVDQLRRTKRHGQIVAMMPETIGGAVDPAAAG